MARRPRIIYDFEANAVKLISEVQKSRQAIQGMSKDLQLVKWDSIVNLSDRAVSLGKTLFGLASNMASFGSEIERNARAMGMSISEYQQWTYVAKAADVETEQFMMGIRNLTNVMSDSPKKLSDIGISAKDATGSFKSMDVILPEIIARLNSTNDVTRQNALAMDLFGTRSGMAFANLVREGKNIDQIRQRFHDMGLEIETGTIQNLAKSEQAFKDLSFAGLKLKAALLPIIEEIARATEWWATAIGNVTSKFDMMSQHAEVKELKSLKEWLKYSKEQGASPETIADYERRIKEIQDRWRGNAPMKGAAGGGLPMMDSGEYAARVNAVQGSFIDFQVAIDQGWKYTAEQGETTLASLDEAAGQFAETWGQIAQQRLDALEAGVRADVNARNERVASQEYANQKILEGQAEFNQIYIEAWDATNQMYIDIEKRTVDQSGRFWTSLSSNISDVWATNVSRMITDSQNAKDALNNIWKGMADAFISAVTKMIVQWVIFGNVQKGGGGGGGGWGEGINWGGIITSIIGLFGKGGVLPGSFIPFRQFAGGGITDRPTLGLISENRQREAVVPLQGGNIPVQFTGGGKDQSQGSTANIFQIYAMDPISWRDFVRRNPEAIIEALSRDSRGAGSMRGIIKGVG